MSAASLAVWVGGTRAGTLYYEDYAYSFVDDMGGVEKLDEQTINNYMDEDQLARTLGTEMTFITLSDGTVVAFHQH